MVVSKGIKEDKFEVSKAAADSNTQRINRDMKT